MREEHSGGRQEDGKAKKRGKEEERGGKGGNKKGSIRMDTIPSPNPPLAPSSTHRS